MFKKSLMLLVIIGTLAVMAFGVASTGAWFTDTDNLNGNYVVTGTLDIEIDGSALIATNLEPGPEYTEMGTFCVNNKGSIDSKWYGYLNPTLDQNLLSSKLLVRVTMNPTGSVYSYGPPNEVLLNETPVTLLTDSANPIMIMNDADWPFGIDDHNVACYQIDVRLSEDAPDTMQGSTFRANLILNATQYSKPTW